MLFIFCAMIQIIHLIVNKSLRQNKQKTDEVCVIKTPLLTFYILYNEIKTTLFYFFLFS